MLTYGKSGYEEGCLKLSLLWRRLMVHIGDREPLSFRELQSKDFRVFSAPRNCV